MSAALSPQWGGFGRDPWGLQRRSDRDFAIAVTGILLAGIMLAYLAGQWPSPVVEEVAQPVPPVVVSLPLKLPELEIGAEPKTAPPPPRTKPPKSLAPQGSVRAESRNLAVRHADAATARDVTIREKPQHLADQAGLAALQSELRSLRDTGIAAAASRTAPVTRRSEQPLQIAPAPDFQGAGAAGDSGTLAVGRAARLSAHQTGDIAAVTGPGGARQQTSSRPGAGGPPGRSVQEIQWVFDQHKLGFYSLFRRAARMAGARRRGSVLISLTISPGGQVTQCHIVSSSFRDPALHEELLHRVRMLRFESRDVPEFTYSGYPITFIP